MAEYKLTYFNSRGIAEPIRFIFAYAGVEFEDDRVEREDWPNVKPSTKWGQVPLLKFGNQELAQSATIARFLAKKFNLAGEDDLEAARIDELVDVVKDITSKFSIVYLEQDPEKKKENAKNFIADHMTPCLKKLNAIKEQNGGDWFVGNKVSWADFYVACSLHFWTIPTETDILADFPALKAHQEAVFGIPQIKAWIDKRPQTVT